MGAVLAIIVVILFALSLAAACYWLAVSYALEEDVRADEIHTVTTEDGWRIRLCRYTTHDGGGEPVLLCHGVMANQFNMTLPNGASVTDALMREGYDCWVIDLRGARSSRGPLGISRRTATIDGYILQDLPAAVDYIRECTGKEQVHWVGHSMGGMLLYAFELVHGRDNIASGTTIGSPPGFEGARIRKSHLLPFVKYVPGICETVLRAMAPISAALKVRTKHVPINWSNMPGPWGARIFFNVGEIAPYAVANSLATAAEQNTWPVNNGEIDVFANFQRLQTPLLAIFGVSDGFIPLTNVQTFFDRLPTRDKKLLILSKANGHGADYDHIDLMFSPHVQADVAAPLVEWMRAHPVVDRFARIQEGIMNLVPGGEDASWRKALRRAAAVMDGIAETIEDIAEAEIGKARRKTSSRAKSTRRRAAAKEAKAAPAKKSTKSKAKTSTKAKAKKPTKAKSAPKRATTKSKAATAKKLSTKAKAAAAKAAPRKTSTRAKAARKDAAKSKTAKRK